MTPVRLEPGAPRPQVKHSTTELPIQSSSDGSESTKKHEKLLSRQRVKKSECFLSFLWSHDLHTKIPLLCAKCQQVGGKVFL